MTQPSFLAASLYVALGGGLGAWLRFLTGRLFTAWLGPVKASAFPWATLTVNVIGSLAMGLLVGWLARHSTGTGISSESARLFLGIGLLGGFTTFSSFSLEMVLLFQRGQTAQAFAYAAISIFAGLAALFLCLGIMKASG